MQRQPAQALLIDLDGVLRLWDPQAGIAVEAKYGLAPGALLSTAMQWDLFRPAVAGGRRSNFERGYITFTTATGRVVDRRY